MSVESRVRLAFPRFLTSDVDVVLKVIPEATHPPTTDDIGPVCIGGEQLQIPYRIYAAEPQTVSVSQLSERQLTILACIYSRHSNGRVRQKYLPTLIEADDEWIPPFILQLVGEYVVEIIQNLVSHRDYLCKDHYLRCAAENPRFIDLTRKRVISYWNTYYRWQFPRFSDSPGFQLMKALELWNTKDAKHLLVCERRSPRAVPSAV